MDRERALVSMAFLPALALAVLSVIAVVFGAATGTGIWPPDEVTLAEAVASGNSAEAVRLLALTRDPHQRQQVRAVVLNSSADRWLTPLEAAVLEGDWDMVRILLAHGLEPDAESRRQLRCFAVAVRGEDGGRAIDELWSDAGSSCAP